MANDSARELERVERNLEMNPDDPKALEDYIHLTERLQIEPKEEYTNKIFLNLCDKVRANPTSAGLWFKYNTLCRKLNVPPNLISEIYNIDLEDVFANRIMLENTGLRNLRWLSGLHLPTVTVINISNNNIANLEGLNYLVAPKVKTVRINDNKIVDTRPLEQFIDKNNIKEINGWMHGNPIPRKTSKTEDDRIHMCTDYAWVNKWW